MLEGSGTKRGLEAEMYLEPIGLLTCPHYKLNTNFIIIIMDY